MKDAGGRGHAYGLRAKADDVVRQEFAVEYQERFAVAFFLVKEFLELPKELAKSAPKRSPQVRMPGSGTASRPMKMSLRQAGPARFPGPARCPDPGIRTWGERLGADLAKLLGQFQELFHQEEGDSEALLILNREFLSTTSSAFCAKPIRVPSPTSGPSSPDGLLISLLTASNSIVAECFERIGVTAPSSPNWPSSPKQQTGEN